MFRMSLALFLVQAGFHGYTASMPLALARAGRPDPEIGFIIGLAAVVQIPAGSRWPLPWAASPLRR